MSIIRKIAGLTLLLTLFSGFFNSLAATEAYLLINYADSAKVYRIATNNEYFLPLGYAFACSPAKTFFVDPSKNYRLGQLAEETSFKAAPGYLFRQVMDKNIDGNSYSQHQDQRNRIAPEQEATLVYRPTGAPFSAGPGKKAGESVAMASMLDDEHPAKPGKQWYQIPNGSWYQTWNRINNNGKNTYELLFDTVEERKVNYLEEYWRGHVPGRALKGSFGYLTEKRLLRAKVDASMELINGDNKVHEILKLRGMAVAHTFSQRPGESDVYLYTWNGNSSGRLFVNNAPAKLQLKVESRDKTNRFCVISYDKARNPVIRILGSDVINSLLKQKNMMGEKPVCTKLASHFDYNTDKTTIYAFSTNNVTLFKIVLDEAKNGEPCEIEKITLPFTPASMVCDQNGKLFVVALETVPEDFSSRENLIKGFEALNVESSKDEKNELSEAEIEAQIAITRNISGQIIFSRSHFASLFTLEPESQEFIRGYQVFLDKDYSSCDFFLKNASNKHLIEGIEKILATGQKPGNSIGKVKAGAAGFPDQFVKPDGLLTAVYTTPYPGN